MYNELRCWNHKRKKNTADVRECGNARSQLFCDRRRGSCESLIEANQLELAVLRLSNADTVGKISLIAANRVRFPRLTSYSAADRHCYKG